MEFLNLLLKLFFLIKPKKFEIGLNIEFRLKIETEFITDSKIEIKIENLSDLLNLDS